MKKILFLLLIPFFSVAQVVMPLNKFPAISTNTINAANGTFTTLSVSGTSTLTGQAKLSNTLNIIGNTTINSNQTNTLTTGNTGTVAVLSDCVFAVNCMGLSTSPLDAATYYFGNTPYGWLQGQSNSRIVMPYNCTLVSWTANFYDNGVVASSETASLSLFVNSSTTNTLSNSIVMTNTTGINTFSATGLSVNVNANDYIEAKLICPTWATNPTNVGCGITFWFVRRQ